MDGRLFGEERDRERTQCHEHERRPIARADDREDDDRAPGRQCRFDETRARELHVHAIEQHQQAEQHARARRQVAEGQPEQRRESERAVERAEDPELRVADAKRLEEAGERIHPEWALRAPELVVVRGVQVEAAEERPVPRFMGLGSRLARQLSGHEPAECSHGVGVQMPTAKTDERYQERGTDQQRASPDDQPSQSREAFASCHTCRAAPIGAPMIPVELTRLPNWGPTLHEPQPFSLNSMTNG